MILLLLIFASSLVVLLTMAISFSFLCSRPIHMDAHPHTHTHTHTVADMSLDQWHNTIEVNLTGCFLFAREFMRLLRVHQRISPCIILIGSTCMIISCASKLLHPLNLIERINSTLLWMHPAGIFGELGHVDYSSSKSGLMYGFMRTLKNEIAHLAPRGRVNTVAPGWVS